MVLVFVVLFAVCWLPSHIIYLYRSYHYSQVKHYISKSLLLVLLLLDWSLICVVFTQRPSISKLFHASTHLSIFVCLCFLHPLPVFLPGGHLTGSLCLQRHCSHPRLHQLLPQPLCPLPAEQNFQETVQPAPVLLLSRAPQTLVAEPNILQHTCYFCPQHTSLHGESERDQWQTALSGGFCVSVCDITLRKMLQTTATSFSSIGVLVC